MTQVPPESCQSRAAGADQRLPARAPRRSRSAGRAARRSHAGQAPAVDPERVGDRPRPARRPARAACRRSRQATSTTRLSEGRPGRRSRTATRRPGAHDGADVQAGRLRSSTTSRAHAVRRQLRAPSPAQPRQRGARYRLGPAARGHPHDRRAVAHHPDLGGWPPPWRGERPAGERPRQVAAVGADSSAAAHRIGTPGQEVSSPVRASADTRPTVARRRPSRPGPGPAARRGRRSAPASR